MSFEKKTIDVVRTRIEEYSEMWAESFRLKSNQRIAEDYIDQHQHAMKFFHYHYLDPSAWQERAKWLSSSIYKRIHPNAIADVLSQYNARLGNSEHAQAHIQSLIHQQAYVVVGGQQAGLFTGPLFTIYKAMTIIRLAEEASEKLQHPVIPIFWIAGEDHDFEEINHFYYLDPQHQIQKFKADHLGANRLSVSQLTASREFWQSILQQAEKILVDSPNKKKLIARISQFLQAPNTTWTESFARFMVMLFSNYGLVLLDAADPQLRQVEIPMWIRLITENEALRQAFLQGKEQCLASGYSVQVDFDEHSAHLFVTHQQQRKLLFNHQAIYHDKQHTVRYTQDELLSLVQTDSSLFSNNVLTRPLMQEYVLPVLATVLGKAEIAYWALLQPAFRQLEMQMPILVPRMEITIVEPKVKKLLNRYQWSVEDVLTQQVNWREIQSEENIEPYIDAIELFAQSSYDNYQKLIDCLSAYDPYFQNISTKNWELMQKQIEYVKQKLQSLEQSKVESAYQQRICMEHALLPFSKPQERVYNILTLLNQYGETWLHQMIQKSLPLDEKHWVYEMDGG